MDQNVVILLDFFSQIFSFFFGFVFTLVCLHGIMKYA